MLRTAVNPNVLPGTPSMPCFNPAALSTSAISAAHYAAGAAAAASNRVPTPIGTVSFVSGHGAAVQPPPPNCTMNYVQTGGPVPNGAVASMTQMALAAAGVTTPYEHFAQGIEMQLPMAINQIPNTYEGIPIFAVPNTGFGMNTLPFASLKRAVELSNTTQSEDGTKIDTSKHFHIFVGDLSSEVDNQILKEAFEAHGEVSEAKVIRDPITRKTKGYGFVSFPDKENAEKAITEMNGAQIGRRIIRTNWANRRNDELRDKLTFEQVYHSTKKDNTSVYIGNISPTATEEDFRAAFIKFGEILEVRMFRQHCYGFIRFEKKECATNAIMEMNNKDFSGRQIRCSWGRNQSNGTTTLVPDIIPYLTQGHVNSAPLDMATAAALPYYGAPVIYNLPMIAPHH